MTAWKKIVLEFMRTRVGGKTRGDPLEALSQYFNAEHGVPLTTNTDNKYVCTKSIARIVQAVNHLERQKRISVNRNSHSKRIISIHLVKRED